MDGRWLLLAMGIFLAVVTSRDLVLAWKHQCFKKGSGQLWDVPRTSKPVVFWFLIVALGLVVCLGVWLAATTAMELLGAASA